MALNACLSNLIDCVCLSVYIYTECLITTGNQEYKLSLEASEIRQITDHNSYCGSLLGTEALENMNKVSSFRQSHKVRPQRNPQSSSIKQLKRINPRLVHATEREVGGSFFTSRYNPLTYGQ